jgi:hypothetical protein
MNNRDAKKRLRLLAWNAFFNAFILLTNCFIVAGVLRHWNDVI